MDKQTAGYGVDRHRRDWPAPKWRKLAEAGYLFALLGRLDLRQNGQPIQDKQRIAAYAILALLDGQPGSPRYRLFRGWYCTSKRTSQESLPGDDLPDFEFLIKVAEAQNLDLVSVFIRLYDFLRAQESDCRPLWRRRSDLPWPRTEDILTVQEAAGVLGHTATWLRKQIKKGSIPATLVGRTYLLKRGDLPHSV